MWTTVDFLLGQGSLQLTHRASAIIEEVDVSVGLCRMES